MAKRATTTKAKASKGGRPSPYKPEFNDQAYRLCLLGATDKEIATFFDVCVDTINTWKKNYPEFSASIREGKIVADMQVAHSMFKNTMDREVVELKGIKVKEVSYNEAGKRIEKETVELVPETRVIPADFRNQSLWLRNRQSDKWRDKQEVDHTTKGQPITGFKLEDIDGSSI